MLRVSSGGRSWPRWFALVTRCGRRRAGLHRSRIRSSPSSFLISYIRSTGIHFYRAWISSFTWQGWPIVETPDTDYSEFDQINRIATQRLANAAKSVGVERFIYISSVRAQTAASATRTVRESDEPSPTNQYGRAKLAAEWAIQAAGVPFTIFRPVVIYGPRPKGNMRMVVRFARSPLPLPAFNNRRSLLAVDNLISAIVFALNNPDTIGETYLVADSKPMTMSEIFTILRMVQGRRLKSVHIPHALIRLALMVIGRTDLWSRLSGELIVDTGKLEAAGWRPAVETYDGLREMVSAENEESPRP